MQERLIAAVDLGASKISLSVCNVIDGIASVLFYKETESQGIRHGVIFNPKKVCVPLRALIKDAEEALEINIHEVVVGLPRWKVGTSELTQTAVRSNPDDFITEEEVAGLKDLAIENFLANIGDGDQIYGAIAQSYSVEDMFQTSEADVVGVTGDHLQGHYSIFFGPKKPVAGIDKVMNELGLASRKYFLAEATAETVLTSDEKEHGVAMIEIGAAVTSVSIYHRGVLRYFDSLPFGGNSITSDIHLECGIQDSLAENIKLGFGSCMPDRLQSLADKIIHIHDKRTGETPQLPVKYLSEIIGSRMREIANAALWLVGKSGYADRLRCGIVLTGAGAELLSCSALFSEMSGLQTRVGYPHIKGINIEGCKEIGNLSGVAQLAMISLVKDLDYINSAILKELDVAPEQPAPVAEEAPIEEPAKEEKSLDDLFSEAETKKTETKKTEIKKTPKTISFFGRLTKSVSNFTGDLFDENIGSNEIEEDKENA